MEFIILIMIYLSIYYYLFVGGSGRGACASHQAPHLGTPPVVGCVLPVASCCADKGLLSGMGSWKGEKGEPEDVSAVWTPWESLSEVRHGSSS